MTVVKNLKPFRKIACLRNRYVDGTIWFIATSRNAIAVIGGCLAAYILEKNGSKPFALTGSIQAGLPDFHVPHFPINKTAGNETISLTFSEALSDLGAAVGLVPMVAVLEQVAIAKAFASGGKMDASQEMITLGLSNLLGSFFGSVPVTASFGRSSVQAASGVRTPLASIYSGTLVLLALIFLMPSLAYIPKAILSAVIITSVIFMIEVDLLKPMWKSRSKSSSVIQLEYICILFFTLLEVELIPFGVTFLCCLFVNMEYGILIGTGVHMLMLSYMSNRPHPDICRLPVSFNLFHSTVNIYISTLKK